MSHGCQMQNVPTGVLWVVPGNFGSLQMPYLDGKTPMPNEYAGLHWAWVALPILMMMLTIAALLLVNQRKQWIPVPCYRTPNKVPAYMSQFATWILGVGDILGDTINW